MPGLVILLTYKRYIHKEGKRHGPYYYKNFRDENGKVKNVYLGKVSDKGKKPLKITIIALFLLLIAISALFFIQNRAIVLNKISAEESVAPLEVDQILIKVLVKAEESLEKELRVMNIGNDEKTVNVELTGLLDIVSIVDKEFLIKPGQTKIVKLNFSSFSEEAGIEQTPGVYIGKAKIKSGFFEKEVPVIAEIESKNVLFDMNLNPVARDRTIKIGEATTFEIRVFNLKDIESYNVYMDYFVKDTNGNTIISERENIVVKTQASFFKTLKIPENLRPGSYVFVAQSSLGNSVGTASYLFEIESAEKENKAAKFIGFCRNDPLCWALSIIVLLLMFTVGAYAYFFVGAYVYKKIFGGRIPKPKENLPGPVIVEERKEKAGIFRFLINWKKMRWNERELRIKKKLELKSQKLMLKEQEERLKLNLKLERQKQEVEQKRREKEEEEKGRLEQIRQKELKESEMQRIRRERKKFIEQKKRERKKQAFEFFHKLGLVKTESEKEKERQRRYYELKTKEKEEKQKERGRLENLKLAGEQKRREKEEEEKSRLEQIRQKELKESEMQRIRRERKKFIEQKKRERKKRAFEFFHKLGLVKTESEKEKGKVGKVKQEQPEKESKEDIKKKYGDLIAFIKKWRANRKRARDIRHKKRLELEKQKLKLREREDRIIEKKRERKEERKGSIGKLKRVIDKGYIALDKNNIKKAEKLYDELMRNYMRLSNERKAEIFKDIDSFYKSLLLKKNRMVQDLENKKRAIEDFKKQRYLEEKNREEEKKRNRERLIKLREQKRRERKKRIFEAFHSLGLVKTEKEKKEIEGRKHKDIELREKEERQKEIERKKAEEEKRKQKDLEFERKELEREKEEKEKILQEELREKEERQKEIERKKAEQERLCLKEKKVKQKEEEWRRREEERRKAQEEEKKRKELELRRKELERKEEEEEKRKEQEKRQRALNEIKNIKGVISEKDTKIDEIKSKIKGINSKNTAFNKEISALQISIDSMNSQREMILSEYKEKEQKRNAGKSAHKSKLAEWKARYDEKSREKEDLSKDTDKKYKDEINKLEEELQNLNINERKEHEKWKKLEIKARLKLEEKDRKNELEQDLKKLIKEKQQIKGEYKQGIESFGNAALGKDEEQESKELNAQIKKAEKAIGESKLKIADNEKSAKRLEGEIIRTEGESKKLQEELSKRKKDIGGMSYISSLFRDIGKKSSKFEERLPEKEEKAEEAKVKDFERELKKKVEEKPEEKPRENKEGLFSRLFNKKDIKEEKAEEKLVEEEVKKEQKELEKEFQFSKQERTKEVPHEELEKHLIRLGEVFDNKEKEKPKSIKSLILGKLAENKPKEIVNEEKAAIKKRIEGETGNFSRCHVALAKAGEALNRGDKARAKKFYLKSRELYTKLEYNEKKEIYSQLMEMYNKLSR